MEINPKLTHFALRVGNIEKSAVFYQKYAGLEIVAQRREHKTRVAWLGNPDVFGEMVVVLLELPYESCDRPSCDHFGLALPSNADVDRVANIAREEGVLAFGPKDMGPVAKYLCLILDPDGNRIEFSCGQEIEAVLEEEQRKKRLRLDRL